MTKKWNLKSIKRGIISILKYNKTDVFIEKNGQKLATCFIADSFWKRFKGLMLAPPLPEGCGLLFDKTNSIHMFFMKYKIDVIFLNKNMKIVAIIERMKKRRVTKIYSDAFYVIELKEGHLEHFNLKVGDSLKRG